MPEQTVTLRNPTGLHARPAERFARAAAEEPCRVTVRKGDREADGKSVLSVLTLDGLEGDEIVIATEGEGAEEALERLVDLVRSGLGELGDG